MNTNPSPSSPNLAGYFYASAAAGPDRDALVWEEGTLSYARYLDWIESLRPAVAPEPGTFVGILAHRSPLAYAAVQAILAQGKAYAPMNPGFPPQRNAYILAKAAIGTLIVGEECAAAFASLLQELDRPLRVVTMGESPRVKALAKASTLVTLVESVLGSGLKPTPLAPVPADGSAYVLFTSGSTGTPKGVRVRHDNVRSYIASFLELYPISREDRLSQTFDITFDVSVHDQFVTWAAGAALVSFPEKSLMSPLGYAAEKKVTVWFSVPALAAFLESARQVVPGALPGVRLSLFAGEKLTWKTVELWKTIAPNSELANLYGPTETTIVVLHFKIPRDFPEARCHQGGIPIGHTWDRQRMEIRRADGTPCPDGELGGLWLGGDQVAPGYLGEEKMTADRFIERDGMMWYRSGDLVFRDPEGLVQYQGREDFQVKVMGYRIELGEIENALMRASGAAFAIADVAQIRSGMDEIYCILPAGFAGRKKEIKSALKESLPVYMVPRHIWFSDDIPLNSNGKMDRGVIKTRAAAGRYSAKSAG